MPVPRSSWLEAPNYKQQDTSIRTVAQRDKIPLLKRIDGSTTDKPEQAGELLTTVFPPLLAVIEDEGSEDAGTNGPFHNGGGGAKDFCSKIMEASGDVLQGYALARLRDTRSARYARPRKDEYINQPSGSASS